MMKMPSAESILRSRSATSLTSPMSTPSTKIMPLWTRSPKRAPCASISSGRPFSVQEDVVRRHADRLGELAVQQLALVVAVHRHHVARPGEVEHQLDLLLVPVAGGVDRRVAGRDDLGADVVEPVDRVVDRPLVARDRRGGEDDRVAGAQLDLRVVAVGHPAQRRQRLALGARGDDHELLVGPLVDLAQRHEHALGHVDVAQRAPDVHVLAHRAADERDLAPERRGRVDDLLHAVDVRREAGDDDPALAALEDALEVRPDGRLARARSPRGRRSSSRPRAAAGPRGRARRGARRPRARRRPASGRTCSRR